MAKHSKADQSTTNLVRIASATKVVVAHKTRKRVVWYSLMAVSGTMYFLDAASVLPFGFAIQHVEELILTTGVVRFIGE